MKILAIETSCDETAIALIEANGGLTKPRFKILDNLVSSQIKIHRPFGGVVPSLAKREHQRNLPILLKRIMNQELGIREQTESRKSIIHNSRFLIPDMIAVTVGPGLEPALWTGIEFAKELAKKIKKPLVGASHLKGHLYSDLLGKDRKTRIAFPAVALIVSGGHTILLLLKSLTKWKKLGETRDDAAGEAFDKVARLLELPYPGGPEIEKIAKLGNPQAINFPRPMLNQKNYDFSFSGLKTAVLYYLRNSEADAISPKPAQASGHGAEHIINRLCARRASRGTSELTSLGRAKRVEGKGSASDVAASFQQAAVDVLIAKTIKATKEYKAKSVMLSGGVAANKYLAKNLKLTTKNLGLKFFAPAREFVTDNAAMIAASAYIDHLAKKKYRITARSNLSI